ncbi:MAG: penicillin-binding protein 1C [bacterium]|nr:penicillin-binding protein 1C [bacterium]
MRTILRVVIGLCAAAVVAAYALGRDVGALPPPHGAVTFLDRGGEPLGTVLASDANDAVGVPLARVSPAFLQAIVAAEDARFEQHGALDLRSLARAAYEYAIYGEPRSGGSTIAMQLARLLHPTPSTVRGKLAQIVAAERIAMRSSHRAILEAYVNRVPMGGNCYGVESAARIYFGEPASDLDLAQASILAAVPNDPPRLAPDEHLAAARARARYVLARMVADGSASAEDARRARDERVLVGRHDAGVGAAAHALFYLFPRVRARGTVRTTLDRDLQRFVQAQLVAVLGALGGRHVTDGAALVVENRTGNVLAYVGSPDYFSDAVLGRNDGVQAARQPGSSLKPFMYERALERGAIRSTTILPDVPSAFAIPGGKLYQPADYSGTFSGPVRVRYALANSLNVPAVRALSRLGTNAFLTRLRALGFDGLTHPASFYGLGLTLGAGEVTLWQNARAYVAMARGGNLIPLRLLADDAPVHGTQVGDPATWALVTDMLADPHAREFGFGRGSVLDLPFPAAVKTGTSSDFRDTWTIGFTRDYTVAVWVGNFDGSAMRDVSGVTGAGPLWNRIMLHLYGTHDAPPFPAPPGYVRATICATTGHAPTPACHAIVREWVRPRDLADVRRAVPLRLGATYDAWLATQPDAPGVRGLRIVAPRDGEIVYAHDPTNALARSEQQLALRAAGADGPVRWYYDGRALALDAAQHAFAPVTLGEHTIEARDAAHRRVVRFRVVPAPEHERAGFTFSNGAAASRP